MAVHSFVENYFKLHKRATSNLVFSGQPLLARLVRLAGAPHPAATGGGFGFAPRENPGPGPPKAGAARSPTGQGQFRRDEQGCPKFVAAPHGSFLVARIRHLTSVLSAKKCFTPLSLTRSATTLSRSRERRASVEAERMVMVKRPDGFICRRFRFFIQNVIIHSQSTFPVFPIAVLVRCYARRWKNKAKF
jgi:hypothetical protein